MRKILNTKRFNDLLNLEYLKSYCSNSSIIIEYPLGTKLPISFAIENDFFIYNIELLNSKVLNIKLCDNADQTFQLTTRFTNLQYNLSKSQYVKLKMFVI